MSMNKYMHPRNPYKRAPDFLQLTLAYPDLRKYVKPDLSGKVKINFKCQGAVRELTKCLLHRDFGLTIELPPDRLVPTLPLRMNYLLWIEDLLNEAGEQFHGIDIGTGASCIYPLLAAKYFKWKMTATEVNDESVSYAVRNVEKNDLRDFIQVVPVKDNILLDSALEDGNTYDFCMCNPPFYSDESELCGKARTDRRAPPRNYRSGQNFELVAPGGETAFISKIIDDSVKLRCKVRVYTVMVGHKSNLNKVKELVKMVKPVKMRTTEFCQGRTTRWGIAWTFSDDSHLISSALQPRKEQSKPPFRWVYPGKCDLKTLLNQIISIINSLKIDYTIIEQEEENCGLCLKAYENTWTHSRRKRREERRKFIDQEAVSPCDSVVTGNDSVDSNNPSSPTSPLDSLGYSSYNDTDEETLSKNVNKNSCSTDEEPDSIHNRYELIKSTDSLNSDTSQKTLGESSSNVGSENIKENSAALEKSICSLDHTLSHINKSMDQESSSRKRKLESLSADQNRIKRAKRPVRPLLEAVLALSIFDGDIILSISFVDGTGGRESANQVLQYFKNKLS